MPQLLYELYPCGTHSSVSREVELELPPGRCFAIDAEAVAAGLRPLSQEEEAEFVMGFYKQRLPDCTRDKLKARVESGVFTEPRAEKIRQALAQSDCTLAQAWGLELRYRRLVPSSCTPGAFDVCVGKA